MSLAIEVKMAPMDTIWLLSVLTQPLPTTLWLPTHPYRSASGIGYASKKLPKWWAIQLAIHSMVSEQIVYK